MSKVVSSTKHCNGCNQVKLRTEFKHRSGRGPNCVTTRCKVCINKKRRLDREKSGLGRNLQREQAKQRIQEGKKICKGGCGEKPLSAFYKAKSSLDGRSSHCKVCAKREARVSSLKCGYRGPGGKKKRDKQFPWMRAYDSARERCRDPKHRSYKYYGGRGIELRMKPRDFKFLWFRDKAYLMAQPSIDRIDPDGHYEIPNCRYLELADNSKRKTWGRLKKKKKS